MVLLSEKGLTTLGKVSEHVRIMSAECWDAHIPVREIQFNDLETVTISGSPHPLKSVAQREISARLGIPHYYLQKCPQKLQADNLNHWIAEEKNDYLFFRFEGHLVRAIFTPRYKPMDNGIVLSRLMNAGFDPDTKVQCALDSEFMSLSIPDDRKTFSIQGDHITPGISVSNSEVGLSSLQVTAFFLRLVCTNGMIARSEVSNSYRHISERILNELPSVLENISNGLSQQRNRFQISVTSKVSDPASTLKSFNRQFMLNDAEQKAVDWAWPLEAGDTMFNVIQTYTRAAQDRSLSAESSHRLQKVGGDILALVK